MTLTGAVILAAIAGGFHFYNRAPRFVAWVTLLVGMGSAALVAGYLGGFGGTSVYGVGIFTLLAILSGIGFWFEGHKGDKRHRVRTPIIALLFGVSLMTSTGSVFVGLQGIAQKATTGVNQAVVTGLNSDGHTTKTKK
jgi:hypothetical protein